MFSKLNGIIFIFLQTFSDEKPMGMVVKLLNSHCHTGTLKHWIKVQTKFIEHSKASFEKLHSKKKGAQSKRKKTSQKPVSPVESEEESASNISEEEEEQVLSTKKKYLVPVFK